MNFKNCIIDCHSHTEHSPDSNAKITDMCNAAVAKGVKVFGITDHCECNEFEGSEYNFKLHSNNSRIDIEKTKALYPSMKILTGVELAQPIENIKAAEEVLARGYDVVIGSIHNIPSMRDFYFLDYSQLTMQEVENLVEVYYEQTLELVKWNKTDVLAHLTYPLRYITGENNIPVNMKKFEDIIAEIFKTVIANDKAIEINTSGLRQKIAQAMPNKHYVDLYRDLGGKYITLGADAHTPADVAKNIEDGVKIAFDAGFRKLTYFEKRQPVLINIE